MLVVGIASMASLESIIFREASDEPPVLDDCVDEVEPSCFLPCSWLSSSLLDLNPHRGQTTVPSDLGFMRGWVSH
jgi:hypothetical protein